MNAVFEDFERRAQEVRSYLRLLKEMERPGTQLHNPTVSSTIPIESDWLTVSKATAYLVMYNLVEASIRAAFLRLYDAVKENGCTIREVSTLFFDLWLEKEHHSLTRETASPINFMNLATRIAIDVMKDKTVTFVSDDLPVSGNLDARSIRKLCELHGVSTAVSKTVSGDDLLTIKNRRNALAHGHQLFSECGRDGTVGDLEGIAQRTESYIRAILKNIEKAIESKSFKV